MLSPTRRYSLLVAILLLLAGAVDRLHYLLTPLPGSQRHHGVYVPNGASLRRFAGGQDTTLADLLFLRLVQYIGTPTAAASGLPQLLELGEAVTDLDPLFGYAYEVTGIVLTDPAGRYEESNKILEKGIQAVPNRWQLPFFAAFNRWYGLNDYAGAAELLIQTASLPGSPSYISTLASRLFAESQDFEAGLAMIDAMLGQPLPERVRRDLETRRHELLVEKELRRIDAATNRFLIRNGRRPASLEELRRVEKLSLPPFPVEYDPQGGQATSPLLPKRVRLGRPSSDLPPSNHTTED
jgi:hypothetical protein